MRLKRGVWGIDVGSCALRALRCEYDTENERLSATAFEYSEFDRALSESDADPQDFVREAIRRFRARQPIKGDLVAISAPSPNGFRLWQYSIPVGGHHFTQQLVRERGLTFADAEWLKRSLAETGPRGSETSFLALIGE